MPIIEQTNIMAIASSCDVPPKACFGKGKFTVIFKIIITAVIASNSIINTLFLLEITKLTIEVIPKSIRTISSRYVVIIDIIHTSPFL